MASIAEQRLIFRKILQPNWESIESFVKRLRTQISKCGFQEKEIEQKLKQQISEKCSNGKLRHIASRAELTVEELVKVGKVLETSIKISCTRCGSTNHIESDANCPAKTSPPCEKCNRRGHSSNMCKTAKHKRTLDVEKKEWKIPKIQPVKAKEKEISMRSQILNSEKKENAKRFFEPAAKLSKPETSVKHETADNGNIYINTTDFSKLEAPKQ